MKRFLFLLIALAAIGFRAAAGGGDWRIYAAYHHATRTVALHGRIYVLSDANLYSYSPEDTNVETYDKTSQLSDVGINTVLACTATSELVVVYNNGNIDLLDADGNVFNLPDLKQKSLNDKTIKDVMIDGSTLYITTGSGIVTLNVGTRLFGNVYTLGGKSTRSVARIGQTLYVATADGFYAGQLDQNLLDASNWQMLRTYGFARLIAIDGILYAYNSGAAFIMPSMTTYAIQQILSSREIRGIESVNGQVCIFTNSSGVYHVNGTQAATKVDGTAGVLHMSYLGGTYWAAADTQGLIGLRISDASASVTTQSIIPNSPFRDYAYKLSMEDNQRLLVAGGYFEYNGVTRKGTLMKYENDTWTTFDEAGPTAAADQNSYVQTTDLVQDPADSEHHFASSARGGLFEFKDYKLTKYYNSSNSPLVSILPNNPLPNYYTSVMGLQFDAAGNLWMLNSEVDTVVRIKTAAGPWRAYYYPEIADYPTVDNITFDQRGWAWITSRRSTSSARAGILVVNTNGTVNATSDDTHRFISTFSNQDGTSYTPTMLYCMREDLDGAMWMGCDRGIFVTYRPSTVFDSDFYFTQVKVPRNDGTNLADYLLSDVSVRAIAIDGGNRKWVGTGGSGVFLLSADGLETIHQFTTDNSPLPSNNIYDIAINGQTGEVFFATEAGLVSYQGDATDPAAQLDEDNVRVYPNPVRPEHQGDIIIQGLVYNAQVKIVNASGRLVHQGQSTGGSYSWNGRLASGKRCASGIYYVLATNEQGDEGVVAKFLIVAE